MLKGVLEDELNMELLFQELANVLNIPSAKYDVVTLNKNHFLISQSFLSLQEYLFDYYNTDKKTFIDVEELVEEGKKINQDKHVRKTLFIDLLTNHYDRFPHNFKVIMNDSVKKIAPLYDNGLCVIGELYKSRFTFPEYKGSIIAPNIIKFLISDNDFKNWVLNYINKINPIYFKEKIKKEKGIYIDDALNEMFTKKVLENHALVKSILKNS